MIFSFGEIDVRAHVEPQISRDGRDEHAVIGDLADCAVRLAQEAQSVTPATIVLLGVPPPAEGTVDPERPYRGTLAQRVGWTQQLNRLIATRLAENGSARVVFVDYPAVVADDRGALRPDLSDGSVHLVEGCYPLVRAAVADAVRRSRSGRR